jgi:D-glycero-D-manno-heptose 1,7-bisphosphate phosphatase
MKRAVFLDRDGTVNVEKDYLYRIEDFEFIPGVPEAIAALKKAGFLVVVVTNQSGVARGYYGLDAVDCLHEHIQAELARYDTQIDAFYVCPHHPTEGFGEYQVECDCRKGAPGMLLQAAAENDLDLSRSFIVGDKLADVLAGERAGCTPVMVLTGYGARDAQLMDKGRAQVCADLADAVKFILST